MTSIFPGSIPALVAALALALAAPVPAAAQDVNALSQELQRLQRDITDLQRTVFAGAPPPAAAAGLSASDSPESQQATARLQLRIQDLERELRTLTGRFEEIGFQLNTVNGRLDRLISDVDFRLRALEGGAAPAPQAGAPTDALGQPTGPAGGQPLAGLTPGETAAGSAAQQNQIAQGQIAQEQIAPDQIPQETTVISSTSTVGPGAEPEAVNALQPGQQSLGSISQAQVEALRAGETTAEGQGTIAAPVGQPASATVNPAAVQQASAPPTAPVAAPGPAPVQATAPVQQAATVTLPAGTEREQYQFAYNLLRQDIAQAEAAFTQFLEQHREGSLAGHAKYWLGETHYARRNYREAASVFLDAYTNYPDSSKASASLLKLGMSLSALGQTEVACTTFAELQANFAQDDPRVLERATSEAARIGCS